MRKLETPSARALNKFAKQLVVDVSEVGRVLNIGKPPAQKIESSFTVLCSTVSFSHRLFKEYKGASEGFPHGRRKTNGVNSWRAAQQQSCSWRIGSKEQAWGMIAITRQQRSARVPYAGATWSTHILTAASACAKRLAR